MSLSTIKDFQERILQASKQKEILRITGSGSKDWYGNHLKGEPLSTKAYSGILNYQPDELVITVKAGTPLQEVEAALAEKGQQFAFEPPHFGSATIGGMVASGLAGPGRVSVGGLRDFVLGAKIMDGQGQAMDFGGTVMKNVAGYDVARLMPSSMGTLGLLLEVSIKVLPRTAASATVKAEMEQSAAIQLMNLLASQPWPLNASAWVDGVLYLRLSGAKAAVQSAISSFAKNHHMQTIDEAEASHFWLSLREQTHPWFQAESDHALWRLALPSTTDALKSSGDTLIEWHGGQRWVKGFESPAEIKELKSLAQSLGGHASVFRSKNKTEAMLSSLKDHPLTAPLATVEERLRKTFDPQGVFATGRLI